MIRTIARGAGLALAALMMMVAPEAVAASPAYIGYVEADILRAAPSAAGKLVSLAVASGRRVAAGEEIGQLDAVAETAQRAEAQARLAQAEAQLADIEEGRRPPEIAVIEAQRRQAEAQLHLSTAQVARQEALVKTGAASREALDQAVMAVRRDTERVRELDKQLEVARLAGRDAAILAARAAVDAAKAALAQAEWRLAERRITAPAAGQVTDIIHRPGDVVPVGGAVALILSPDFIKVRFFAPQRDLAGLTLGTEVQVTCDGCQAPIAARVTYVAPEAQFTPPVIYSDQTRDKLVFLIEARASDGALPIAPGQPVGVTLAPARR